MSFTSTVTAEGDPPDPALVPTPHPTQARTAVEFRRARLTLGSGGRNSDGYRSVCGSEGGREAETSMVKSYVPKTCKGGVSF